MIKLNTPPSNGTRGGLVVPPKLTPIALTKISLPSPTDVPCSRHGRCVMQQGKEASVTLSGTPQVCGYTLAL